MVTYDSLIFGKNPIERIVSCEVQDATTEIFIEEQDGTVRSEIKPNQYWVLSPNPVGKDSFKLEGNLYYKWMTTFDNRDDYNLTKRKFWKADLYSIHDEKEAAMVAFGFTYYKGLKVNDVSVLAFDIESTSLEHTKDAKVLLISNTFRKNGKVVRKLFSFDDYKTEAGLFDAWCSWVREMNPSMMIGHNIFSYDLPYMDFCAQRARTSLKLGRDGSDIKFNDYDSKFRKDGSQFYDYKRCFIYGRETVDTMFLAIKYDVARKYDSYRLKSIISHEGLEVDNRQHYDAGTIKDNYKNPTEWAKIKAYAEHDADDAIALYDLMIPAYFYLTQSIPKSFQSIMYSASGSQINGFLVRSYLQEGHSVPRTTEGTPFEGAISIGHPGLYKNVFKVDVSSLYPSIMLQWQVYDKYKDPNQNFLKMVSYFTEERLNNKKLSKETGDRYYKDLEQAQKIVINSAYGMMGANGLNFNSPYNASFVTRKGREILQQSLDWATNNGFQIVNADTDSISVTKDGSYLSEDERKNITATINSLYPEKIRFEDDGYYPSVVVVKAKNYVLKDEHGKIKIKGSALKATTKEKALQQFIKDVIDNLLDGKKENILNLYHDYVREIHNLTDISRWTSKKTVTEKVLNPERTNEQKVADAIEGSEYKMGDKCYFYFDKDSNLKLQENWDNDHDTNKLLGKLYNTLEVFETVLDMTQFTKYHLKSHPIKVKLNEVLGLPIPEKIKRTRKPKNEIHKATA